MIQNYEYVIDWIKYCFKMLTQSMPTIGIKKGHQETCILTT